jgi:hypothetical protein
LALFIFIGSSIADTQHIFLYRFKAQQQQQLNTQRIKNSDITMR